MDKTLLKNTYFGYLEIKTPLQAARIQKLLDERYYNKVFKYIKDYNINKIGECLI